MTTDELKGFGLTDEQCQQVENLHNGEILAFQTQISDYKSKLTILKFLNHDMSIYTII